jgi:hypothetical protein
MIQLLSIILDSIHEPKPIHKSCENAEEADNFPPFDTQRFKRSKPLQVSKGLGSEDGF